MLEEEREETDDVRICEEVKVSLVGLRVVAKEPFEAIVGMGICWRAERKERGDIKEREERWACLWNVR